MSEDRAVKTEERATRGKDRAARTGPLRVGILTVSDGVHAGTRDDGSGRVIAEWVHRNGFEQTVQAVVPDEPDAIVRALMTWADESLCDLLLTTGGTGLAERDVTPEATRAALEREAPGVAEVLRARGLENTPFAALGRGVAGVRARTLIVNLPGSPAGVEDGLDVLTGLAGHAVRLLQGDTRHD